MNKLEQSILGSAVKATRTYSRMTGGGWLSEGPELFLHTEVARGIWHANKRNHVLVDWPNQNIDHWAETALSQLLPSELKNRPRQRPDIFIFDKDWDPIAVIEIKTKGTDRFVGVMKDAEKVERYCGRPGCSKTGYLLVYFEGWTQGKHAAKKQRRQAARAHLELLFKRQEELLRKAGKWTCIEAKAGAVGGEYDDESAPPNKKWWAEKSFA